MIFVYAYDCGGELYSTIEQDTPEARRDLLEGFSLHRDGSKPEDFEIVQCQDESSDDPADYDLFIRPVKKTQPEPPLTKAEFDEGDVCYRTSDNRFFFLVEGQRIYIPEHMVQTMIPEVRTRFVFQGWSFFITLVLPESECPDTQLEA